MCGAWVTVCIVKFNRKVVFLKAFKLLQTIPLQLILNWIHLCESQIALHITSPDLVDGWDHVPVRFLLHGANTNSECQIYSKLAVIPLGVRGGVSCAKSVSRSKFEKILLLSLLI